MRWRRATRTCTRGRTSGASSPSRSEDLRVEPNNHDKGHVSETNTDEAQLDKWDPEFVERLMRFARPFARLWFRSEVRGLDLLPPDGALLVSNHSGGSLPMDVPIFAAHFYEMFGYHRPLYTLSHDLLFRGPTAETITRMGFIRATRINAAKALRSGGLVTVFP